MTDLLVHPQERPLVGSVPVPSDKSIGHRSLMLAAIARGASEIRRFSYGEDNVSTLRALAAMGVAIDDDGAGTVKVAGVGLHGLRAPAGPLDCGNSGTTMRLFCGLLAGQRFAATLVGDASLSRRPMARVARPLRMRGAQIEGEPSLKKPGEITAPLVVGPLPAGVDLCELEHAMDVASAQVKSALLLSGLWANGATRVHEPVVSRDHTERMLRALDVPLATIGSMVELDPTRWSGELPGFSIEVPGDLSASAFLLAAGTLVPGSRVTTRRTGMNPTRTGFLAALRQMGGAVETGAIDDALGEPFADVTVAHAPLRPGLLAGELLTRAIDEVPIACALMARARGTSEIADAAELRVKESDRIAEMASALRGFGVEVEERPDGLRIEGRPDGALRATEVDSKGDHRIAMSATILGLLADGPTRVRDVDCVATSFPKFVATLRGLGARIDVV